MKRETIITFLIVLCLVIPVFLVGILRINTYTQNETDKVKETPECTIIEQDLLSQFPIDAIRLYCNSKNKHNSINISYIYRVNKTENNLYICLIANHFPIIKTEKGKFNIDIKQLNNTEEMTKFKQKIQDLCKEKGNTLIKSLKNYQIKIVFKSNVNSALILEGRRIECNYK